MMIFIHVYIYYNFFFRSMQEERRDGESGRTPTARAQETTTGFHRPSAPYSTGYF